MKLWQALRLIGLLRCELLICRSSLCPSSEYLCIFWWLSCSESCLTGVCSLAFLNLSHFSGGSSAQTSFSGSAVVCGALSHHPAKDLKNSGYDSIALVVPFFIEEKHHQGKHSCSQGQLLQKKPYFSFCS